VSLGVQGLEQDRLKFLGRLHDSNQALDAVRLALAVGVPQVSADLIYGVFRQDPHEAVREVTQVANLGVHHLSAYMLTVEPNTRFGALHAQGKLPLLDDALVAQSFNLVSAALGDLGFEHYEVSNFARDGHRSEHNQGYWLGRDYLGLGTGAYGTVTLDDCRLRYRNFISPERYLSAWNSDTITDPFGALSIEQEILDPKTSVDEALMLGLRLIDGIDLAEVARVRGEPPINQQRLTCVAKLLAQGKLKQTGSTLQIPKQHWLFADQIVRELL